MGRFNEINMKKIILLLFTVTTISSCAQKTEKNTLQKENIMSIYIPREYNHINKENFVEELSKEVKRYDEEPKYFLRPIQNNCVYELLVNDYPVYKDYGIEKLSTPIEINHAILQSGPQTVTVRLYPLGDALKRAYGEGETVTTLLPKTEMKISVVKYEAFNISQDLDDEIIVKEHIAPTKEDTNEFIGAGLPYYEYTFTFNAEVPYSNIGWLRGEDLTKFDKKILEEKVLAYYKSISRLFDSKKIDSILQIHYGLQKREVSSEFKEIFRIKRVLEWYEETINTKNKNFFPLKDYEMHFFGNKRIVALKNRSLEPVDRKFRGKSAFGFKYKENENTPTRGKWLDLYLYLPKGQPLDSLQMIP